MRFSQYLVGYLRANDARGKGKGITVGTYLSRHLRGHAKTWKGRYARSLENSLERHGAIQDRSTHGSTAWYSSTNSEVKNG